MKLKNILILAVICAVSGLAAYLMLKETPVSGEPQLGDKLLKSLSVNDIAKIVIVSHEEQTNLYREDLWTVMERYQYQADFGKIRDFVKKISDVKIGNVFSITEDAVLRLALALPDKTHIPDDHKGTRVMLKDQNDTLLADMVFGKTRQTGGGHYVKIKADNSIYLIDQSFWSIDSSPADWLHKEILNISPQDIEWAACYAPDNEQALYQLQRPEQGQEAELVESFPGKTIKTDKINSVIGALSSLRLEDIAGRQSPAEISAKPPHRFEYRNFNGTIYRLQTGIIAGAEDETTEPARYFLTVEADYTISPTPSTESTDTISADTEPAADTDAQPTLGETEDTVSPEQLAAQAESLNQLVKGWIYIIPKWKFDAFETVVDNFYDNSGAVQD